MLKNTIKHYDKYSIINGFMNSELILNDYTVVNVDKCYSKYFGESIDGKEAYCTLTKCDKGTNKGNWVCFNDCK